MEGEAFESVCVTGGSGFVGYHIVSRILEIEPNCQISVIDLPTPLPRFQNVTYYDVDVSSKLAVQDALYKIKPKVIWHAACTYSLLLPAATHSRINTQGTQNVLSAAVSVGTVKALVYHSSSSVIETGVDSIINADETYPVLFSPQQKFPYPLSKALAEQAVLSSNRRYGMLTTSIRPAGTFGEADTETMEKLIAVAKSGRAKIQMGDGKNVYDFLYVKNLAHAHLLVAKTLLKDSAKFEKGEEIDDEMRADGEAFMITNDEPWLFWDFTRAIAKEVGCEVKKEEIKIIPRWLGMVLAFFAEWFVWIVSLGKRESGMTGHGIRYSCLTRTLNIEKAKRVLGYRPLIGMQEGLEKSVAWFEKEGKKYI